MTSVGNPDKVTSFLFPDSGEMKVPIAYSSGVLYDFIDPVFLVGFPILDNKNYPS